MIFRSYLLRVCLGGKKGTGHFFSSVEAVLLYMASLGLLWRYAMYRLVQKSLIFAAVDTCTEHYPEQQPMRNFPFLPSDRT